MKNFNKVFLIIGCVFLLIGLIASVAGLALGATFDTFRDGPDIGDPSLDQTYTQEISALDFGIAAARMTIKTGDAFRVESSGFASDVESYVQNGTWYIRSEYNRSFGFRFTNHRFIWSSRVPEIVVTLPDGFTADSITISVNAGTLQAQNLSAHTSSLHVGAGELLADRLVSGATSIDCGVGHISVSGTVTGSGSIECGVGQVDLNLTGQEEDYSFRADVGLGQMIVNGKSYSSLSDRNIGQAGAPYRFDVSCGIGQVDIMIQ